MGQYWRVVNLDKKEFLNPYAMDSGAKLWEQLANRVGDALIVLCAAMPEPRGGGDLDLEANWHGPERTFQEHNLGPGPMPEAYPAIARRTVGRWAGDRIALVGDYAEAGDLPKKYKADKIYEQCVSKEWAAKEGPGEYTDITDDVIAVLEHELDKKFERR